jgi:iron complex outermembrane receptor protein
VDLDGQTVNRTGRFGKEDDNYTIAQIDLSGELDALGMTHNLLLGVEYDRERASFYQENISSVPSINAYSPLYGVVADRPYPIAFYLEDDVDGRAFYIQDLIEVTDRWSIVAGVRYSEFEDALAFSSDTVIDESEIARSEFDHTNFQLGSTYRFNARWSVFGGYATGFDVESTTGSSDVDGNPFDPEESEQYEAGVRYSGDRLRGSASIFQIQRINVLTADPLNPDFSIQTGEVQVQGLEIEGVWAPTEHLSIQGGYAYLDSEITKSNNGDQGQQLEDTPEHQANVFIRYDVPNTPLQVRLGANYVGERQFSNAGVDVYNGVLASSVRLPDYVTVDLGAALTLADVRFDLALSNVFDEAYYTREFDDFSVLPGEPRQVSLRVSRQF